MPIVRVSMFGGRSEQQKAQLANAIADAMHDIAGSSRDAVNVLFDEVPNTDWYLGGRCLGESRDRNA